MITQLIIQQVLELTNWPFAAILCLLQLGSALIVFFIFDRAVGLSTLAGERSEAQAGRLLGLISEGFTTVSAGIGDRLARLADAIGWHAPAAAGAATRGTRLTAAIVILFLIAPLLLLVPVSFSGRQFLSWPPVDPGFKWYAEVLSSRSGSVRLCAPSPWPSSPPSSALQSPCLPPSPSSI